MRNFLFSLLSVALMLSACDKPAALSGSSGTGGLRLSLQTQEELADAAVRSNLTDYVAALPAKDAFNLTVTTSTGQQFWTGKLTEWPEDIRLNVGSYSVTAVCGSEEEEGFAKPRFAATEQIEIAKDDTTDVLLTAKLANCMVKVTRSAAFNAFFAQSDLVLTTGAGTEIAFPATEMRPAFLEAWKFTLAGSLVTPAGTAYPFSQSFESGLKSATLYTIQLDVTSVGTPAIVVTFDNTVETVELEEDLYE